MKKHHHWFQTINIVLGITLLLIPYTADALCFSQCDQAPTTNIRDAKIGSQSNDHRRGSHNFGNRNNAFMGTVHFRVGHERIEFSNIRNSKNNIFDASITSVINLGDS